MDCVGDGNAESYLCPISGEINIDQKKVLGKGSSAVVYEGTYGYDKKTFAVKQIMLVKQIGISMEPVLPYLNILHPNVLHVLTVEQDYDFR